MKDGATKGFEQAYNAQAGVDGHAQIIVACALTQEATDVGQFLPLVAQIEINTGQRPAAVPKRSRMVAATGLFPARVGTVPGASGACGLRSGGT